VEVPEKQELWSEAMADMQSSGLGLPVRWDDLTIFSSDVSKLLLLSERGRRTEAYREFLHSYWMRSGLRGE
jgi:hypothetical protein